MKPKIMKNTKIKYNGEGYENIISLNRSYDYSSFTYLDSNGSEVVIYLEKGKEFNVLENKS